jgi:hypothetical protein
VSQFGAHAVLQFSSTFENPRLQAEHTDESAAHTQFEGHAGAGHVSGTSAVIALHSAASSHHTVDAQALQVDMSAMLMGAVHPQDRDMENAQSPNGADVEQVVGLSGAEILPYKHVRELGHHPVAHFAEAVRQVVQSENEVLGV